MQAMTFIFPRTIVSVGICEFAQDRATTRCVEPILSRAKPGLSRILGG